LYDNANCICDKYGIVEAVWSSDYIDDVDDPRIAKLVSRLREDVEPNPKKSRYIVTVHGRGYKLADENA
jgi:DNA-binding winged helix-turn-helix (wHTH) protein